MSASDKSDAFEFEKVDVADARQVLEDSVKPAALRGRPAANWDAKRNAGAAESMRTGTIQWILKLPAHVQPRFLQVKYPRVANRMAALWDDKEACERYFEDLLTDKRGGRKGFPLNVAQEIATLRDFHFRLHHKDRVAWDHVEWS